MLSDFLLANKTYTLQAEAKNWKTAIKIGIDLLEKAGCVEKQYCNAVIQIAKDYGPYYVIAPGIAMPHARPESGVKTLGFSLVTLKKPVSFGHATNDPVDILLCLAAPSKEALNEKGIVEVMDLFDGDAAIEALRTAKTDSDLKKILDTIKKEY